MSELFDRGRQAFLEGSANWLTDTIKAVLVDLDDYAKLVTGATNATPISVTSTAHGLTTGDIVAISNVVGNAAANGTFKITVTGANTFTLQNRDTGANIAGTGAYTSGGYIMKLNGDLNLNSIPSGARVAASGALGSKTVTDGVADAADVTFTAVSGDRSEAIVVFKDSGVEATSRLIAFVDTATGLPVTPNGSDIQIQWDNGATRIFRI